ncbi:M48 family metallopeptidase [Paludisphaera soli]|uniref:M48 family metallopeptidase n=1 Tax=Paludisphaera soli TaxID=2712865 RepID=UPI0013ED908D|nr:M48 family metallopeptidase [Paludisphaera soli]
MSETEPDRPEFHGGVATAASSPEAGVTDAGRVFTPEEVRAAFRGAIPPKKLPASYRVWALIVACVMVALPLIYVGIVTAAGYAMYWHATHNHVVFQTMRGKAAALSYFGPLLVLGIVVLFLAKPLFARRGRSAAGMSVTREEEPALFALVDGVCEAVGSPRPVRVDVDCRVNASAGAEHGLVSLLRRRLVLTVGLPLVAATEADQFAGVLAHEFGHFAQSAGMGLTYVVNSVNHWFARVVYERDAWDESLNEWATAGNLYSMLLVNLARLMVWASRRVLWVLMQVGHAASCTMSRQMEFDADRCQAMLAGSPIVASTMRRIRAAAMAEGGAMSDVSESWKDGKLPDDLPRLIEANVPQIPPAALRAMDESLAAEKTGVFDTHPADKDRIAAASRLDAPGVFHLEGPATGLFRDFEAVSRAATAEHYRGLLGGPVEPGRLVPYREVVRGVEDRQADYQAFNRVYPGTMVFHRPIPIPEALPPTPDDVDAARAELERIRAEQAATRAEHDARAEADREGFAARAKAQAAAVLMNAGYRLRPAAFGIEAATLDASRSALEAAEAAGRERTPALDRFDGLCTRRMAVALGLLGRDDVAGAIEGGEAARAEVVALLPAASALAGPSWRALAKALQARAVLFSVLGEYQGNESDEKLRKAIFEAASDLHGRLVGLSAALGGTPYPFDRGGQGKTLVDMAVPAVPDEDDVGPLLQAAEHASERLVSVYVRCLGRLSAVVERVEAHLGLPALAFDDESGDNRALG